MEQSTNFTDDIDCGSFFDDIDDLLDFPSEDVEPGLRGPDCPATTDNYYSSFPSVWSTPSDSLPGSDSVFSNNSASDLSAELSVPYEDIVQLEWLSNFVDDSLHGGSLMMNNKQEFSSINKDSSHHHFQTSSPVSVLESSSSCSLGEKTASCSPEIVANSRTGRARSKRPRPAIFTPQTGMQLTSSTSSEALEAFGRAYKVPSDTENFAESQLLIKIPKQAVAADHMTKKKKKKKIKCTVPQGHLALNQKSPPPPQAVRKCMHCEITKTPQWRAGPMGPKTLCNACGVRYKSGRLFPEYRPAASPTFVPSLHSNSHKKVVEMRSKNGDQDSAMMAFTAQLIPNNSNLEIDCMRGRT